MEAQKETEISHKTSGVGAQDSLQTAGAAGAQDSLSMTWAGWCRNWMVHMLDGARIAWVGVSADLPKIYSDQKKEDLGGRLVTPSLID